MIFIFSNLLSLEHFYRKMKKFNENCNDLQFFFWFVHSVYFCLTHSMTNWLSKEFFLFFPIFLFYFSHFLKYFIKKIQCISFIFPILKFASFCSNFYWTWSRSIMNSFLVRMECNVLCCYLCIIRPFAARS